MLQDEQQRNLILAIALAAGLAIIAAALPAWRASRLDPVAALNRD